MFQGVILVSRMCNSNWLAVSSSPSVRSMMEALGPLLHNDKTGDFEQDLRIAVAPERVCRLTLSAPLF